MIELIVLLIIVIICYRSIIYSITTKCVDDNIVIIDKLHGSRIEGIHLARELGFPTINLKLSKPAPCGFYTGNSQFGAVTIVVGKEDRYRADVHFVNFNDEVDKMDMFMFWDVKRVVNRKSDVISTFNRGCC